MIVDITCEGKNLGSWVLPQLPRIGELVCVGSLDTGDPDMSHGNYRVKDVHWGLFGKDEDSIRFELQVEREPE